MPKRGIIYIISYSIWSWMRMKFNIFKRAFSLTELLIVLVVVAVLFAAMVPMVSKRSSGLGDGNEPVWMYVKDDPEKSAFFDPGSSAITSTAYVGFRPTSTDSEALKPFSKVVLRAKELQNHIQFRSGNDGNGSLAGIFLATINNMFHGSRMSGDTANNYNDIVKKGGKFNTVLGSNAASNISNSSYGTAVGASASMGKASNTSSQMNASVAVGNKANMYGFSQNSVLIGSNVGKSEKVSAPVLETVAIGANNLGLPSSSGQRNVLLGYGAGAIGFSSTNAMDNVVLNSGYYGTVPSGSTIIGYKTYEGGFLDAKNITAIGYNACASFQSGANSTGSGGSTTCIGYNSAGKYGKSNETKYLGWEKDDFDHLFIGGKPNGGLPGRAVLEIHNIPYKNSGSGQPNALPASVGPTVVLNSHLVVRGNLYLPDSRTGQVAAFNDIAVVDRAKPKCDENGDDTCSRNCGLGRKKWRTSKCKILGMDLGTFFIVLFAVAAAVFTAGGALAITAMAVTGWSIAAGSTVGMAFAGGSNYKRGCDPHSATAFVYYDTHKLQCSDNYSPYFTSSHCPNVLKTSDLRLKENISENTEAIEKILLLEPYNYTYKSDKNNTPQVGVIAQDLEKVFPTAVSSDKDGYKNIRWDEVFFVNINAVKSLDKSVSALDKEIETIESDVNSIDKDQKSIKKRIKDINKRITKLENN